MMHHAYGVVKNFLKGVWCMPLTTSKMKGFRLEDLLTNGDGAQLAGMKDRRTFKAWAEKLRIEPVGKTGDGRVYYKKPDVDRVVRAFKAHQAAKEDGD